MSNHAEYSEVIAQPRSSLPDGSSVAVIRLIVGETAWDPSSTEKVIDGPARIDYFFAPDGGVTAQVSELDRDL